MSRLTEKRKYPNGYEYQIEDLYENAADECIDKLGKLEDLEEELGCPLEVVFGALKQDYIYTKDGRRSGLELGTFGGEWCICCGLRLQIRVNAYKETWWLKEDRSE